MGNVREGVMRPCVRRDLMTLCDHTLNEPRVWRGNIDFSFSVVVAGDEEGGSEIIGF